MKSSKVSEAVEPRETSYENATPVEVSDLVNHC